MSLNFEGFAQHIEESIKTTFRLQFSTSVEITRKSVGVSDIPKVDCISQLWFSDSSANASLAIGFSQNVFLPLISKMFSEHFSSITIDNVDACGEMINIIYATARRPINLAGHAFELALPTTHFGQNSELKAEGFSQPSLYFDCRCEQGSFWICLLLQPKLKKAS